MTEPAGGDRLARLERRVATLERLVRQLLAGTRLAPPSARAAREPDLPPPVPATAPRAPDPRPAYADQATQPRAPSLDLEQWFGARGLLLVGVVALLAAAGFFLNYAFERGWIPPWLRVAGAVAAGIGVGLGGERQVARKMRRYGLALVGAGMGLVYLGIWAAAGPYAMLDRAAGVGLVALVAGLATWRAVHHRAEPLALWALLGALLAPVLLPEPHARPEALLAYLTLVTGTATALATRFAWRLTADLAVVGYFTLPVALITDTLSTVAGMAYLALGAGGTLAVWRRQGWAEVRVAGFLFGWLLLALQGARIDDVAIAWTALGIGATLLIAEWAHARAQPSLRHPELQLPVSLESATFLLAPLALLVMGQAMRPPLPAATTTLAAVAAGLLYLGTGWPGRWAPFIALGFGLLAIAVGAEYDGAAVIVGWSTLLVIAAAADRWLLQRAGAGVAVLLGLTAGITLFTVTRGDRTPSDPAFTGVWALALYGYLAAVALAAGWWKQRTDLPSWLDEGRTILWTLAGLAVFGGVSLEIGRFFDARAPGWAAAKLAGDLCLSVFWLLYAGAAVWLGFRRNEATVRGAGLLVAGVAAVKIAIYDLGRLQALYRVGSFFVLALLALAVAYAYNQKAGRSRPEDA